MRTKMLDNLLADSLAHAIKRVQRQKGPTFIDTVYAVLIKAISKGNRALIIDRCKNLSSKIGLSKTALVYDYDKILKH